MDVSVVLANCQNPDGNIRTAAEQQLRTLEESSPANFMGVLAQELAAEDKQPLSRQLAGIQLKNALFSKTEAKDKELAQRWLYIEPSVKKQIKDLVLLALGSGHQPARSAAAQVIGKMAAIDLPANQWPDLIQGLLGNVTDGQKDELKQSTLQSLGYICEDIDPQVLKEQSNAILTAVVHGMRKDETNMEVKLAACQALLNSLDFASENFDSEAERNFIMQVVCESTQVPDAGAGLNVRVASYECLVKIAALHYDKLQPYIHTLFQLTVEAIKNESEPVAQQAVEFWSTICDEEIDLLNDAEEEGPKEAGKEQRVCQNYVRGALKFIVPLLTETLTRQNEDPEDEDWNVAMAAGTCLQLVANTVGDDIVNDVIPFIQQHIASENWRFRDAATLAFGSILEGPSKESLSPLVGEAIPVMLRAMKDPSAHVKDTTAWTIAKICELHTTTIGDKLPAVMTALLEGLQETPKMASTVCWAIHNLAEACEEEKEGDSGTLSPYFQQTVHCLLQVTEREDATDNNLRNSAYEAINFLIDFSAKDCLPMMFQLVPVVMARLEQSFAMQILTAQDKEAQTELQGMLCGCLQMLIQRIGNHEILSISDKLMMLFLQVFTAKSATVQEEALMAVGAVANAIEDQFEKYMPHFAPHLLLGLQNTQEFQVCMVATGIVGDVCRALGKRILPYCDKIVETYIANLQNPALNRMVKPPILSCFSDIAMALEDDFEKYLGEVVIIMGQAASMQKGAEDDYETEDYVNSLREGIFEAFTGIIQGLKSNEANNKARLFLPYVEQLMTFINIVYQDQQRYDSVTRAAVGVIGDLADALGSDVKQFVQADFSKKLIKECQASQNEGVKTIGDWTHKVVRKL